MKKLIKAFIFAIFVLLFVASIGVIEGVLYEIGFSELLSNITAWFVGMTALYMITTEEKEEEKDNK